MLVVEAEYLQLTFQGRRRFPASEIERNRQIYVEGDISLPEPGQGETGLRA